MKKEILLLLTRVLLLAIGGWILFTWIFCVTSVRGNEMFPALKDGDLVFALRLQRDYVKNDVVVYEQNEDIHIGRIVARAGDTVEMDDSGTMLVNGTGQYGEIIYPTYAKAGLEYPYQVPKGTVFILGDYRTQTEDSRDYGAIALEDVKGKVFTILRRRGL